MVIVRVAKELAFYGIYFLAVLLLFSVTTFVMLAFFVSPEAFTQTMVQEMDTETLLALLLVAFLIFFVTVRAIWIRTYRQVWLRMLRIILCVVALFIGGIAASSNTINLMTHMVAGNRYSSLLEYDKRCPEYQKYIQEEEVIGSTAYSIDKACQEVYWKQYRINGADAKSFTPLVALFSRDKNHAYFKDKIIDNIHLNTLDVLPHSITSGVGSDAALFFIHDDGFLYGFALDSAKGKDISDDYIVVTKEKQQAFLEGLVFPGVTQIGHCEGFNSYRNRVRVFRSAQSFGENLLPDDFTQKNTRIEESDDCLVVTLDNGTTKRVFRGQNQ